MIIRPQDKINIFYSGIFVIISLVIIAVSIFMLSSENNVFTRTIDISISVENAQNLKRGAEVQLRGIKIGSIGEISVESLDNLIIVLRVNHAYRDWIRKDSHVVFRTHGVLGDRFIEIQGGTEESPRIQDGDTLLVKDDSVLDKFINKGEDILVVATRVLSRIDLILDSIEPGKFSSIIGKIDDSASSTQKILASIDGKDIAQILKNFSSGSQKLNSTMASMETITQRLEKGPGTLHSLIYDRSAHDDLLTILGGTKRNRVLQYFIRESIRSAD
jgi:phospholipid/cholesterol/gamma-HCH transport system substrate-binding protein